MTPVSDASEPENHLFEAEDRVGLRYDEGAINRIYDAAFDAAQAALLMHEEAPSSHTGVKTRFGYHFGRTGVLSRSQD